MRRSNAQLALMADLVDSAEDLLFVADIDQQAIIQGNAATRRALGREEVPLNEQAAPAITLFKAGTASWVAFMALLRKSSPVRFETTVWVGSYLSRPVEISARLVHRDGGRYAVCIARDISEHRRQRSDLLAYATIDPETELPRAPAFIAQLRRVAGAEADWLLVLMEVTAFRAGTEESDAPRLSASRQAVASLVARFASQHGGVCGLLAPGQYLLALASVSDLDIQRSLEGLRHETQQALRALAAETPGTSTRDQLGLGIGLLQGPPQRLASEEALDRALQESRKTARGQGRLFRPVAFGTSRASPPDHP